MSFPCRYSSIVSAEEIDSQTTFIGGNLRECTKQEVEDTFKEILPHIIKDLNEQ